MSLDPEELRRHILYKRDGERTLAPEIARHMLTALNRGAIPEYQILFKSACWPALPKYVYHTANVVDRNSILLEGLHVGQPGEGDNAWPDLDGVWASQPFGVYVTEHPDVHGKWSRWEQWDVWRVWATGLTSRPDPLNPRCWIVAGDIEPRRLLLRVWGAHTAVSEDTWLLTEKNIVDVPLPEPKD